MVFRYAVYINSFFLVNWVVLHQQNECCCSKGWNDRPISLKMCDYSVSNSFTMVSCFFGSNPCIEGLPGQSVDPNLRQ